MGISRARGGVLETSIHARRGPGRAGPGLGKLCGFSPSFLFGLFLLFLLCLFSNSFVWVKSSAV